MRTGGLMDELREDGGAEEQVEGHPEEVESQTPEPSELLGSDDTDSWATGEPDADPEAAGTDSAVGDTDSVADSADPAADGWSGGPSDIETIQRSLGETMPMPIIESPIPAASDPATSDVTSVLSVTDEAVVDMGPERRSNMWVWIGLLIGVLIAAAAVGYAWWYMTSRPLAVPNLVGKLAPQATQALNDANLRLGEISEIPTDTAPPGTVIEQNPAAGTELKPDQSVNLVLAAKSDLSKVPDVTGRTVDEAREKLAGEGLAVIPAESYNTSLAAGYVISQIPSATTELKPGSTVVLIVSQGAAPQALRVPRLFGLDEADAKALLDGLDLRSAAYRAIDPSLPVGTVVTQTPLPGASVGYAGVVQYLITQSSVSGAVSVPDVSTRSRADAVKRLKARNLAADVVLVPNGAVPAGRVISQMPAPGAKVTKGGTVGLLVSSGPSLEAPVPSLVGSSTASATSAITAAGFRPIVIELRRTEYPAGSVFAQFPSARSPWSIRFPVVVLVAKGS